MDNDERIELLDSIEGDINEAGSVEGYSDSDGDLSGEVIIPDAYYENSYNKLVDQPSINGHVLIGDQTAEELDIDPVAKLESELDVLLTVGGVKSGDIYNQGTTLEQIIRDLFSPIMYPTLTNPSSSVSTPGGKLVEKGSVINTTATVSFNRGTINPAYGTSGYRSGPATSYSLNGGPEQSGNSFFVSITEENKSLTSLVKYSAGEQPKDSVGNDYDESLPAGQVQSSVPLTYEFVYALWANTGNIQSVTKQSLVSFSVKQKEFVFPAQTELYPEVFDVPDAWTVTAIDVFNTLSQTWDDVAHEFDVSITSHNDAGGNPVVYNRYTDNRGYAAGSRKIRIKWT